MPKRQECAASENVRSWHLADSLSRLAAYPLLGVRETSSARLN